MSGSFSLSRQERGILDLERFYDILGIFSDEPVQGLPFTLEPQHAPCLALRGCGITEDESGLVLDVGDVESDGLSSLTLDAENIGLDEAVLSLGSVGSRISARFSPDMPRLNTGQSAKLHVRVFGAGSPGLAVEGEIVLQIHRSGDVIPLPIRVRGVSARIAAAPRFHCDGRPCPAAHDFGRVEIRDLLETGWEEGTALLFRCTVANMGGRSCVLSVSVEGEGFEFVLGERVGGPTAEIPPGGSIDVAVKPAFGPLGPRYALLHLVVEGARNGLVVVTVRLAAEVHSVGPLFTLHPRLDRMTVIRGCRCLLPVTAANLGTEGVRIAIFPMLGERALKGTQIDLPPGDGVTPAISEVVVGIETEELEPGEHTLKMLAAVGVYNQLNPAGAVVLAMEEVIVDPSVLEFGSIPLGKKGERAVLVRVPSALPVIPLVPEELGSVLSVEAREEGRFVVRVSNDAGGSEEPCSYSGIGLRITIPAVEFSRDLPVSFRRLRSRIVVPEEVNFGSAVSGESVSVEVRLANEGDEDLKVRAFSTDAHVTFAAAGDIVIPGGAEEPLRIILTLPDVPEVGTSDGVPFSTSILLTGDSPPVQRHLAIKGMIIKAVKKLCSFCKAINTEPGVQNCWFCQESLADAPLAATDKVGRCALCGGLFSNEYSFCPKDGGDLRPFAESS